ncbi:hypothetical protein [Streptomyces sp. NPDC020141]|uniref:hypothetical protein n=1 Tax=Streptomyces sp. NPDC020141 TaxID=3365065 RepID=UPI0037B808E3
MNTLRAAAATAAAAAMALAPLSAAGAAPAPAPPKPAFLAAKELPGSLTPWTAQKVRPGRADDHCVGTVLPKSSSSYRDFRTELDTSAHQTVTVAASEAGAKRLVTKVRAALDSCLDRLKERYPTLEGTAGYHGRIDVEEGAHVYSVDTADPAVGSSDVSLHSVGRDGRTVTVVGWGQLGDLGGAPLKGFQKTARTSVAKLY